MARMFHPRSNGLAWCAALALLAGKLGAQDKPAAPDDARLRQAWSYLTDAEQDDALARFEAETPQLDTFQNKLLRFALALEERDHSFLPRESEIPFFDPARHAPAQPIPRHRLALNAPSALRERERMLGKGSNSKLRPAWRYDWSAGDVVRCAVDDARARAFESALAGLPPDVDLAEALVERALDGGAHRREFAAFGHAYTNRTGDVFPGITLYDAWSSGAEMEMPDIDVLGVVHELRDEWKKWIAPVPPSEQDDAYKAVADLFVPIHAYRGVRTALARTYLSGSVELRDGYANHIDRLHALWDAHASTPNAVAALVPDSQGVAEFVANWALQVEEHPELRQAGAVRHAQLDRDRADVREFFAEILKDCGALERTAKPAPRESKQK
jgi:hypothetical protein